MGDSEGTQTKGDLARGLDPGIPAVGLVTALVLVSAGDGDWLVKGNGIAVLGGGFL